MNSFSGILPAVVTPFDQDGHFLPASFELLLERLYGAGVHGIYLLGSTGEGLNQPVQQRMAVAEQAVRLSPSEKSVIIHVGAKETETALALARHAEEIGADAVSSLPPSDADSFDKIRRYYEQLAAATDLPLLLYYFPEVNSGISTVEQILELCGIPNVAGLKFTDFNLYRLSSVREEGWTVFNGRDEVLAAGLFMGADGGIGSFYNLIPEQFVHLYELAEAGDWEAVRSTQKRINELIRVTLRYPVFPAIKAMLSWSGIECGSCLAPAPELTDKQAGALKDELTGINIDGSPVLELAAR